MLYLWHVDKVKLPRPVYGGVSVTNRKINFAWISKNSPNVHKDLNITPGHDIYSSISSWVRQYSADNDLKFIALGIASRRVIPKLFSKLWLELDVVPLQVKIGTDAATAAGIAAEHFDDGHSFVARVGDKGKVETPQLVRLADYEDITPPDEFRELVNFAKKFKGKKISYFSATPQGGGVAIMRHALLRLYELLDVDAGWYVMEPEPLIFDVTKQKFHNVLQSVNERGTVLTEKDISLFNAWSARNAEKFHTVFRSSDVIVIDDPQPAGLVPYIKESYKAKVVFRSHIQLQADLVDKKGTPQNKTWKFIWDNIKDVDKFVSHPVDEFIPREIDKKKLIMMPPATDPLDGLNKELTDEQKSFYFEVFNNLLEKEKQKPLDVHRPYIIQVARFDPSKGIPDVLEAFSKLRKNTNKKDLTPQLVIVGNASVDDPDGKPIYDKVVELINTRYKSLHDDIKVVRAPHYDQLLNALLRSAAITWQLSHKEGFEFKITEALMKGIPTVIYNVGGMPLQIKDEETGFIVPKGDTEKVAEISYRLLTNVDLYRNISANAAKGYYRLATTVPNAIKWLRIANELVA